MHDHHGEMSAALADLETFTANGNLDADTRGAVLAEIAQMKASLAGPAPRAPSVKSALTDGMQAQFDAIRAQIMQLADASEPYNVDYTPWDEVEPADVIANELELVRDLKASVDAVAPAIEAFRSARDTALDDARALVDALEAMDPDELDSDLELVQSNVDDAIFQLETLTPADEAASS